MTAQHHGEHQHRTLPTVRTRIFPVPSLSTTLRYSPPAIGNKVQPL
jgi:hypothetical protein